MYTYGSDDTFKKHERMTYKTPFNPQIEQASIRATVGNNGNGSQMSTRREHEEYRHIIYVYSQHTKAADTR